VKLTGELNCPCPTPFVAAIMHVYTVNSSIPRNLWKLVVTVTVTLGRPFCSVLRMSWYDRMGLSGLTMLGMGAVHVRVAVVSSRSVTWMLEGARGTEIHECMGMNVEV